MLPPQHRVQVVDARALVSYVDPKKLWSGGHIHGKLHPAAATILQGVSCNFGDRSGKSSLIQCMKPKRGGNLPGALAGIHDVVFRRDGGRKQNGRLVLPDGHAARSFGFITRTQTSSRPRDESR